MLLSQFIIEPTINHCNAETGILRDNRIKTMSTDGLATKP